MAAVVLGLQGAIANGSEPTFDGQPMQAATHLRWSFLPQLGFPPGGFWLCRKVAQKGEQRIVPPSRVTAQTTATVPGSVAPGPGTNQWEATAPPHCQSVTLAGCAAEGCREVLVETFGPNAAGELVVTGREAIAVPTGSFRIKVMAAQISCVRVVGAGSLDEYQCGTVQPPECGGGTAPPGGGNPPGGGGPPGWGSPGDDGWQCWTVPFTLPVTRANWPARYYGAPDPLTTAASAVEQDDIAEAARRLGSLQLAAGLTPAQQTAELKRLEATLIDLVKGFPAVLLPDVPIPNSPAGNNAPRLNLSIMQQLLLLSLDPYFARVLGLYFVDTDTQPGVTYDYCLTGYWGNTDCQVQALFPGMAPAAPLARGAATFAGMGIAAGSPSSLWRWLRDDANGNYVGQTDPGASAAVASAMATAIGGIAQGAQPQAMLAAATGGSFPFVAPAPAVTITLPQSGKRVDVQVSGFGTVSGVSGGNVVATTSFNAGPLTTVTINAASADAPIDTITVIGQIGVVFGANVVIVGEVDVHLLAPDAIGTRYALLHGPKPMTALPAPPQPYSSFRHRQADVDPASFLLVPHSLIDVEWAAPDTNLVSGDPISNPVHLPPPTQPVGFVAERQDSGKPNSSRRISKWIATASQPTPSWSKVTTARCYRFAEARLPDPAGGWSHRLAAFDVFGALGAWGPWTAPMGVEKIAAAPTGLRVVQFDNTAAGGGSAAADGSSWNGGTLIAAVNWSGAAFLMYPDVTTARVKIEQVDIPTGAVVGTLTTHDMVLPARSAASLQMASVNVVAPPPGGTVYQVTIATTPDLPQLGPRDPAAVLILTLPDGTRERYVVRPASVGGSVVAQLAVGPNTRVVASASQFVGQTAYLVQGWGTQLTISVPLSIPVGTTTARAQVSVTGSSKNPFDPGEQIVDPNGANLPRPEPQSVALAFTGVQRLVPPAPPTPVHDVHHVYYDPADFTGRAGKTLPFGTSGGTGISGYILTRAPMRSLMLADIKRRIALGNAADLTPEVDDSPGVFRPDLKSWIATQLPNWLAAYNQRAGMSWTMSNVLEDAGGQRSFIDHFYGGLLDDELRALADIDANRIAFARVNKSPLPADGTPISDTVDGTGYGRTVYTLAAANNAGSQSGVTNSIGPYYTRIVTSPRPPVLYKLQPTEGAIVIAWALDSNPDVAAYSVYRVASIDGLADLRYFGPDPSHPSPPASLASILYTPTQTPCLAFGGGQTDPRIVGFVPDPRLVARDYDGSDMGEVALPGGPAPDQVSAVYRLAEFDAASPPLNQPQAFNYWTPPAVGGIAQLVVDSPTRSRLTGLRIGLGRGVPVVVVAIWHGQAKVLGQVSVRRAGFIDGTYPNGNPMDPNAIAGAAAPSTTAMNAYAVVAVDIYGNLSNPSTVFAAQMLAKAS